MKWIRAEKTYKKLHEPTAVYVIITSLVGTSRNLFFTCQLSCLCVSCILYYILLNRTQNIFFNWIAPNHFFFIVINYIFPTRRVKYIFTYIPSYLYYRQTRRLNTFTTKLYYMVSINNTYFIKTERFRAGSIRNVFNFYREVYRLLNINHHIYVCIINVLFHKTSYKRMSVYSSIFYFFSFWPISKTTNVSLADQILFRYTLNYRYYTNYKTLSSKYYLWVYKDLFMMFKFYCDV